MPPQKRSALALPAFWLTLTLWACAYTLPVKDGPTAYDLRQYARAIPMLQSEYAKAKSRQERGPLAYKIGDSYRRTGRFEQAAQWFDKAARDNYGPEALRAYAFALKNAERYAEAREAFKNLSIEIGSPYEYRKEITACAIAEDWIKQIPHEGWNIEPAPFNSPANDFAPALLPDRRIVFSSDRAMSKGEKTYDWTGLKFTDLYVVSPDNASAQLFDPVINTEAHEGTACFNANATEMFFVRAVGAYKGDDVFCKIHFARRDGASWSSPTPLPFQKERVNYMHPTLSADGATLYFAANDPEGWGGYDIYAAQRNPRIEGQWDEPRLLGRNVNTPGNELFPTLHADTLYFASDGHTGMGGLDIFRSYRVEKMGWTPPLNLKAPVNSGADDFGFVVAEQRTGQKTGDLLLSGYLASNRPGGRGGDDIYRFERRIPPPRPAPSTPPPAPAPARLVLEVYVLEKIFSAPDDPNSRILGRKPLAGATLQVETGGGKKQQFVTGEDGLYRIEIKPDADYAFTAKMNGYLANAANFSSRGLAPDPQRPEQVFELEIVLDKKYVNREIVLENIYYDFDKWDIRPDAEPTLDRLAAMLLQNPDIRILLGSHTDCRGSDSYNLTLSQRRAQSAVNYLIGKGINPDRLSAQGFGESKPAVNCLCSRCTEAEHQTNRRTVFVIQE